MSKAASNAMLLDGKSTLRTNEEASKAPCTLAAEQAAAKQAEQERLAAEQAAAAKAEQDRLAAEPVAAEQSAQEPHAAASTAAVADVKSEEPKAG
ncbi:MAG: hypothetical protein NTW21_10720 [Verrucomicrobia bacterium]|nr:hypothetical protein [Verrucomicrobiota bacterium]